MRSVCVSLRVTFLPNLSRFLLGQFGVGLYSTYFVPYNITVTSKHNDDEQHIWEGSSTGGSLTIRQDDSKPLGRTTRIVPHREEDQTKLTNESMEDNIVCGDY